MRNGRNAIAALVLALLLSTPTFAGIMTGEVSSPAPTPTPAVAGSMTTEMTDGGMQTGEAASTPEATDTVTEIALNLLQSVLTLF
jgi:hypothetical protein